MKAMVLKVVIASLIFFISIYMLSGYISWQQLFAKWKNIDFSVLFMALALVMFSQILRGLRVFHAYFVQGVVQGERISLKPVMMVSLLHNAANFIFPMRLGELIFPALSRQTLNIPLAKSTKTLIGIRLFDLYTVLLLLVVLQHQRLQLWFGAASVMVFFLLLLAPLVLPVLQRFHWFYPPQWSSRGAIYAGLFLSLLVWGVKLLGLKYLLNTFLVPDVLSFSHAGSALLAADLSSVLPVNGFASSGSYELAFVFGLSQLKPEGVVDLQVVKDLWLYAIVNMHIFLIMTNILSILLALVLYFSKQRRAAAEFKS